MALFVLRRSLQTLIVLLVASFVVYILTAYSGDPLAELRTRTDPAAQRMMADLIQRLDLETPPVLRYFGWLAGAAGCLIGRCDLGVSITKNQQPVTEVLQGAVGSTLQLVTLSAILAVVIGVAIGMITALRQKSGFDYTVTFFAFVFYSLPIFWVAVLLKEYGAIRFNAFLGDPTLGVPAIIALSVGTGLIAQAVTGGELAARLRVAVVTALLAGTLLGVIEATQWLRSPSLGVLGVTLLTLFSAVAFVYVSTGLDDRRAQLSALIMVVAVAIAWSPLQYVFYYWNNLWSVPVVAIALAGIGALIGFFVGGNRRRAIARVTALIGASSIIAFVLDQMLLRWAEYLSRIPQRQGIVSTIGASTPSLAAETDVWLRLLDSASHLILPTIALMVISVAGYTRYARSSLLEVMNQDYVRTARAKGLSERAVIVRHALRNALIPITTVVALDFGAIIGGAIITERIFAWQGMGSLFSEGLYHVDVNLVMGFFLITGLVAVVFNVIADVAYSLLDPRIRVS
ncbi:MAG: ABC transporter permease subunit [Pontimonas sp.]